MSRSPRSMPSNRSPVAPTRWGMSIAASGSVQRTSSRSPGASDLRAFRVLSAGRGHFSPVRSSLVTAMPQHAQPVCGASIAIQAARIVGLARGDILHAGRVGAPRACPIGLSGSRRGFPNANRQSGHDRSDRRPIFRRPIHAIEPAMIKTEPGLLRRRIGRSRAQRRRP